ncbi:MAG: hypothetical protein A3K19_04850 [Lentisphaerae bacterium RIFOXYB12_FULL_65_16]|nr:MAG: hypothetical protein A3K18_15560 [Lentisphaerae bacterium RIFOXYA12_64_32]OGV89719.1 MAG: hypothetical protein A3K19_04850 [Lentisphaerae bacterium RIFOXYB12_FULL_65_16]
MTVRAIVLGFLGVVAICFLNYINDNILKQTFLLGNYLPVAVYGAVIVLVVAINPLLARVHRRLMLSGREIALVLAIVLAACCIPGDSLLRCFTTSLVLPHHFNRLNPGWREKQVLADMPPHMLADVSVNEDKVLNGFVQGLGETDRHIRFFDVPWEAWARPLLFWLPLLLSLWFGLTALAVVIHRQWSEHELLPYPLADFANSLLPEEGQTLSPMLRDRLFWIATGAIFLLHFNNFLYTCFPEVLIPIRRQFDFTALTSSVPFLQEGGGRSLMMPTVFFTVIGFAYLVPSDVSFSLAIGPVLWCITVGFLAKYGLSLTSSLEGASGYIDVKPQTFLLFGANLAVFGVILYCGRKHYLDVARRACGLRPTAPATALAEPEPPEGHVELVRQQAFQSGGSGSLPHAGPSRSGHVGRGCASEVVKSTRTEGGTTPPNAAPAQRPAGSSAFTRSEGVATPATTGEVWAARLFVLCMALFWVQMVAIGLDWQLAMLYMGVVIVFYVVVSRVLAETGLFYCQPFFFPCVAIWGVMGSQALGPQALLIMFMLTTVIMIDPRESIMPLMTNSLKLLERRQINLPRGAWLFALALIVGLCVAIPTALYFQYDLGYAKWDVWGSAMVPQMACKNAVSVQEKLTAMGALEQARNLHGWARFGHMAPNHFCMSALAAGFAVTLLVYVARLRLTWWPLHPVLFLTWPTYPSSLMWGSFLIGWLVKTLIVKYGGVNTYQKLRPIFYGLIAGEVFGAFVPTVIGAVYYWITGEPPGAFRVLPT